jgi:hypothetical protein
MRTFPATSATAGVAGAPDDDARLVVTPFTASARLRAARVRR